jgi:hypothetical protein
MDKWQALDAFWNSFGWKAFDEYTVPDDVPLPYITYETQISDLDEPVMLTASLWYHSMSWEAVSIKASEISEAIGGGYGVRYDSGRLWVTKAVPFAQRVAEPSDEQVRRIIIQINAEYQ